jgi:uncharacterized membrane protein HdeD (DUF308 family)
LTSASKGTAGTYGISPSRGDILATMQPTTGEEYRRTSRRSWVALAAGIVLIAGAVFLSMRRLASDVLTTVAGIAGFLAICYGLVIQVMALLNNREPDE